MSKIKFLSGKNVLWEFIISEKNKMSMPLDLYLRKIEDYVSDEGQSDDENMPVYIEYDIVKKCPIYKGKPIDDRFIFSFVERFNEKFPHMKVNEKIFKAYLKSGWLRRISPLDKFRPRNLQNEPSVIEALLQCLKIIPIDKIERKRKGLTENLIRKILTKWLVGMVAIIIEDDSNFCQMDVKHLIFPVLIGEKRLELQKLLQFLLPDDLQIHYTIHKMVEPDLYESLCRNILVIFPNLDEIEEKDLDAVSPFLRDTAYSFTNGDRLFLHHRRYASICGTAGTVSPLRLLQNIEVVPVHVQEVDFSSFDNIDKADLLREAYHLFLTGFDPNLTGKEKEMIELLF